MALAIAAAACGHADAEAPGDAGVDARAEADADAACGSGSGSGSGDGCACAPDAAGFDPPAYVPTHPQPGACTADDAHGFAAACAADPNDRGCASWLAAHAACAHCLLGDTLLGPFRKNVRGFLEISPGTCGQALAGESYDAGPDAHVGGCGAALEAAGACVTYACEQCDDGDACRTDAYRVGCAELVPGLAACDASACVLGSVEARAEAIARAVCGDP